MNPKALFLLSAFALFAGVVLFLPCRAPRRGNAPNLGLHRPGAYPARKPDCISQWLPPILMTPRNSSPWTKGCDRAK